MKIFTLIIFLLAAALASILRAQPTPLLYGMSSDGGSNSTGTIFSYDPIGDTETVLWSFGSAADGRSPRGNLIWDPSTGLFYSMTIGGGYYNVGTIVSLDPTTDSVSLLWSFGEGNDGANPYGNLVYDTATGLLYGMTANGGTDSVGALFSFDPAAGTDQVLWSFGSGSDGANPQGGLVFDPYTGLYYGMTPFGGLFDGGTIFTFNPQTNTEAVVWDFGSDSDAQYPAGSMVFDTARRILYAMTSGGGGIYDVGALISFDPADDSESVIYSFGAPGAPATPDAELVIDPLTGIYYGMTTRGGTNNAGTIISFDPTADTVHLVWSFGTGPDGSTPYADLLYYGHYGLFYGLTEVGGAFGNGAIISFDPATGRDSVMWSFEAGSDGKNPYGSFVLYTPPSSSCPTITVTTTMLNDSSYSASAAGGFTPYTYAWSTVPSQYTDTVTGLRHGYQYTVIVTDQNGCTGSATVNLGVGIIPLSATAAIDIYPNPTSGTVSITGLTAGQTIAVYDYLGEEVNSIAVNTSSQQLDLSAEEGGIYFITISDRDGSVASQKKVVKEN